MLGTMYCLSNPDKVKKDLLQVGVVCEELGGKIVAVEVSAKTGKGVEELLEMISLVAQVQTNLTADKRAKFSGVVIESGLDKRRGPLTTVLVRSGVLALGDNIRINGTIGRIKAIFDVGGQKVKQAFPSDPVVVLGLPQVVDVGGIVIPAGEKYKEDKREKSEKLSKSQEKKHIKNGAINLIVKADTKGG